jgi:hypothetical protein
MIDTYLALLDWALLLGAGWLAFVLLLVWDDRETRRIFEEEAHYDDAP